MNNDKKILFLVHLPPPVHGAAMMNSSLVESEHIRSEFETQTINITAARSIADIGRFSFLKFSNAIQQTFEIIKSLKRFKPSIVYITLSPTGFAFYRDAFFSFLAKRTGAKMIFHLHGKGISTAASKNRFFKKTAERVFKNSTVILLSERLEFDVCEFINTPHFVVPNGIELVPGTELNENTNNTATILFLSNYVKSKGVLVLIDAVERVARNNRNFAVKLVGRPADVTNQELHNIISEKKLQNIIEVTGPKYGEDKYRILRSSDILVFPTFYSNEAFPLVILEAMQFSLPVISTPEGGIPDMVSDGETGFLVPQHDSEKLAEKLELLISDPQLRVRMGKKGKEVFLKKFSLPVFEHNMLEVFNKVINQKKS